MSTTTSSRSNQDLDEVVLGGAAEAGGAQQQVQAAGGWTPHGCVQQQTLSRTQLGYGLPAHVEFTNMVELDSGDDSDCSSVMSLSFGLASPAHEQHQGLQEFWGSDDEREDEVPSGMKTPTCPITVDVRAVLMAPRKRMAALPRRVRK